MNKFQLLSTCFLIGACSVSFSTYAVDDTCDPEPTDMTVNYGDYFVCSIEPEGDSDIYRVWGNESDRFFVEMVNIDGIVDPQLQITDPKGEIIFNKYLKSSVDFSMTLTETGYYTIIGSASSASSKGQYSMQIVCTGGTCLSPPSDTSTIGLNLINPCAIFDTRDFQSGRQRPLDGGEAMRVDTIMDNYSSQGGTNGSCGLPPANRAGERGGTVAVLLNLVALNTMDLGNLRAWDPDDGVPDDGGILVYNGGQRTNVVLPLKIADSIGQGDDGGGLYIQNSGSLPMDVRGVLLGYYTN